MRDKTVVLVVCDAVRGDYLNEEDTPCLLSLAKKGVYVERLRPSFGFCERVEIFSGTHPKDSGYFTALTFDREKSDFRKITKTDLSLLRLLKKKAQIAGLIHPFLQKAINYVIIDNLYLKKIRDVTQPTYEIPLDFLPEVALTEDYIDMRNRGALSVETIFDVMVEDGRSFLYDTFASLRLDVGYSDSGRVKKFFSEINKRHYDLSLLYLGDGDRVGHWSGPDSRERRLMTAELDTRIKEIVTFFSNSYKEKSFVILGDHGMLPVANYLNAADKIMKVARINGLKTGADFRYFLDSTLIRVWCQSETTKKAFMEMFESDEELITYGSLITEKEVLSFDLPENIGYYGDLIWMAKPGTVIFPDFFHTREKVKGMHGYDPNLDGQKGFALIYRTQNNSGKKIGEARLIDICPTICELLNIRIPKSNKGKSLI